VLYTETQGSPFTFTHDEFSVTSDFDNTLCGEFTYAATFEASSLADVSLPPIAYDPEAREFSVFSDDINLVGLKSITVGGYYKLHPANAF